jgi:hypothetical protein
MSEATPSEPTEASAPPARRALVAIADFEAVDFEAPIRDLCVADVHEVFPAYQTAFAAAAEAKDGSAQSVFRLLLEICTIVLQLSDKSSPWCPLFTYTDGSRACMPEDFRGDQTAVLSAIVGRIVSPGLRARIADIAWSNNRRDGASAAAAVNAYCDIVLGLLDGNLKTCHGRDAVHEAVTPMHRAMQMAKASTARNKRPPKVTTTFEALYAAARDQKDVWSFVNLADLALDYGLRQPAVAAVELEAVASSIPHGTHPTVVKRAWDLAGRLYQNLNDKEGRQRCLKAAVTQLLAVRDEVKRSAGAEAAWVMEALQLLRHVEGEEKLEYDLEIELRRLQKAQLKQMGSFQIDLKLEGIPERIAEHFGTLSLSDSLKEFAFLTRSRDPATMRAEALETRKTAPFMAMMSVAHLDGEGRTDARSAGAPHDGEPDETWYRRMIGQSEGMRRTRAIRGFINPARLVIEARFGVAERHFNAIVGMNGLVPDTQRPIVALGLTRLFQGDMMSATHLLIPQLEPCLRHLLKMNGYDPSKRRDDSTEEDFSLSGLFAHFREELEQILTPAIAFEIDLLFNAKPGPELRHELAHGQISAGGCFHDDVYYANWFIYHLCCLFMIDGWDGVIARQLAEDE